MVKNTPQLIKNTAFGNRFADLAGGDNGQNIIGWPRNGGVSLNQQFTFVPEHGKQFQITTTDGEGNVIYISSPEPSEGDNLVAGAISSTYTVKAHNGYYLSRCW